MTPGPRARGKGLARGKVFKVFKVLKVLKDGRGFFPDGGSVSGRERGGGGRGGFYCGVDGEGAVAVVGVGVDDEDEAGEVEDGAENDIEGIVLEVVGAVFVGVEAVAVEEQGHAECAATHAVGSGTAADVEPVAVAATVVAHESAGLGVGWCHDHCFGVGVDAVAEIAHVCAKDGAAVLAVAPVDDHCPDGTATLTHALERSNDASLVAGECAVEVPFEAEDVVGHRLYLALLC